MAPSTADGGEHSRDRRGGLKVEVRGGVQLCQRFMTAGECSITNCPFLHLPKAERQDCPNFSSCGICKFGEECWYPHRAFRERNNIDILPNCALQVNGTHWDRTLAFVHALQPLQLPSHQIPNTAKEERCEGSAAESKVEPSQGEGTEGWDVKLVGVGQSGEGKKRVKVLLLHVARPLPFLHTIDASEKLRPGLSRSYYLQHSGQGLIESVQQALRPLAPLENMTFRIQAFPKELEKTLGDGPGSVCECCSTLKPPNLKIKLAAKDFTHMLFVVVADGIYHSAVAPAHQLPVLRHPKEGEAVCKAYFKLKEAMEELKIDSVNGWRCIDVGAAPGGWTQCLQELGAEQVIAVDPGDLTIESMDRVRHMKCKIQECVKTLEEEGVKLDMLVCDMNCSPPECVKVLKSALPLLKSGAKLVVTFKKFSEIGKATMTTYSSDQEKAQQMLASMCREMKMQHLFANTQLERTMLATLL